MSEIGDVEVVYQRKNASADRHAGSAAVSSLFPGFAKCLNLLALLGVQGFAALIVLQCRTLKIHAEFRGPAGSSVRAGTPPDAIAKACRIWFEAQQPGGF